MCPVMMRRMTVCLCLILCVLCSCRHEETRGEENGRTLLVYMVAGNNLESDMQGNVVDMCVGLKNVNCPCRLVVYWDGLQGNPKISSYWADGAGHVGKEEVLQTYEAQNSASPEVLKTVLTDMMRLCPSESYGLILSSHGTGWLPADKRTRAFGVENNVWMESDDMAHVLEEVAEKPFDYIMFDACLMADVQVAYELRHAASYLIASVAEVLSAGFPYESLMPYFYLDDAEQSASAIARLYIQYYRSVTPSWGTMSVVRCGELERLAASMKGLLDRYPDWQQRVNVRQLQKYDRMVLGFDYSIVDCRDFANHVASPDVPQEFLEQLTRTLLYSDYVESNLIVSIDGSKYSGLGMYVPQVEKPKWNEFFRRYAWCEAAGFSAFDF